MVTSGAGGSLATELSRGGHGWWRAGNTPHAWAPGREHGSEPPGPAAGPGPWGSYVPGDTWRNHCV